MPFPQESDDLQDYWEDYQRACDEVEAAEHLWHEVVDWLLIGILIERDDLLEYWVNEKGAKG